MRLFLIDHESAFVQRVYQILRRGGPISSVEETGDMGRLRQRLALDGKDVTGQGEGVVLISSAVLAPGEVREFGKEYPAMLILVAGGNDPERMRAVLGEGARGFVRRSDVADELPAALATVTQGGIFVPPVVAMQPGTGPLMTVAGPVPAGFFREDAAQQLTTRQREILVMIHRGRSNTEIAEALNLTVGTVKIHVTAIFKALGVRNRTQAMVAADWLGLPGGSRTAEVGKAEG
jgi:DNA-binding NarL/FixJ family response regulator